MKRIFVDTSVVLRCYFVFVHPILEYCSLVWGSAAECHLQLLERHVYSEARLSPDESFLLVCHRHHVVGLRMLYKVNSNSNHCLFSKFHLFLLEFGILELRPQLIHWSLNYHGTEHPNLLDLSCCHMFKCGMTYSKLCLTQEHWMGSRVQQTFGCFPELCFLFLRHRCL